MTKEAISKAVQKELTSFFKTNKKADLLTTYLFFLEKNHRLSPVIFMRDKTIYKSKEHLLEALEADGRLWRETEITIRVGREDVNEETKKIYICPFTGKIFGDNTHPNPQDAIYDWVSTCPENTERVDGMKVKRFFVSEDPEMIKNYIQERKKPIKKTVFSSGVTGKLFNSKERVIEDFVEHQIKPISLVQVPSQNRFQLEPEFMEFVQTNLEDENINAFVEDLSNFDEYSSHIERWLETASEQE